MKWANDAEEQAQQAMERAEGLERRFLELISRVNPVP